MAFLRIARLTRADGPLRAARKNPNRDSRRYILHLHDMIKYIRLLCDPEQPHVKQYHGGSGGEHVSGTRRMINRLTVDADHVVWHLSRQALNLDAGHDQQNTVSFVPCVSTPMRPETFNSRRN